LRGAGRRRGHVWFLFDDGTGWTVGPDDADLVEMSKVLQVVSDPPSDGPLVVGPQPT
jgi:hypothetical protein